MAADAAVPAAAGAAPVPERKVKIQTEPDPVCNINLEEKYETNGINSGYAGTDTFCGRRRSFYAGE